MDCRHGWVTGRGRWTGRRGILVAGVASLVPVVAAAQDLEMGVGIARTQNPVQTLSTSICPAGKTWALEGRGGLRFSRIVALEGTVGYQFEKVGECADGSIPPIPSTGPFQQMLTTYPEAGYPFVSTDARIAFEPSSPSGPIWLRAFGGYGRVWSKGMGYWLAGAGLVYSAEIDALLDFEWNWFDEPFDEVTRDFLDGALIGEESIRLGRSQSTFRIKAGFRWRP